MSDSEGCVSVWEWLCVLHLDQYLPVFQDAGFETLLECQGLTQDQLETIGITLPGHRKRILASLQKTHHTHPEREHDALLTHLAAEGDQKEEESAVFRPSPLGRETLLPAQRPVSRGERPVPKERSVFREEERDGERPRPVPRERSVFREEERDGERPRPVPKERNKYRSVPVETLDCGQTSLHPNPTFCPTTPNPNSTSYSTAPHSTAQDPPLPPIPPRSTPNGPPLRFIPTSPKHSPMAPKPRCKHNNTHSSTNTPTTVPLPSLSTNPPTVPLPSFSTNPPTVPLPSLSTNPPTVPLPSLSTNPPTVPLPSLSTNPPTVPLPSLSTNPPTVPLPSLSTNPPTVPLPSLSTNPPTVPLLSLSPSPVSPARHPQQVGEEGRKPSPVSPARHPQQVGEGGRKPSPVSPARHPQQVGEEGRKPSPVSPARHPQQVGEGGRKPSPVSPARHPQQVGEEGRKPSPVSPARHPQQVGEEGRKPSPVSPARHPQQVGEEGRKPSPVSPARHPQQVGEEGRKPSPVSPSSSSSSFSVEQYDQSSSSDQDVPTLPPKVYVVGAGPKEPRGPAPISRRPPVLPPRTTHTHSDAPVDEPHTERTPPPPPRTRVHNTPVNTQPALPMRRVPQPPPEIRSDFGDSSDDSEDPDQVYPKPQSVNMADRDMFLPVPGWGKGRYSSLCSDDELLDDDNEPISNRRSSWQDYGLSTLQESVYLPVTGRVLAQPPRDGPSPEPCPVLKMGWLDKNPPQGSLYYQRRWVKLDVDYLRYFDNDKEVYSKRIIPTAAITGVTNVGEQKFEVVTINRTFLFRAESDFERNEWVSVLQNFTRGRQEGSREIPSSIPPSSLTPGSPLTPEQQGYLELRGLRSKLYTVVYGDKVFLYKNMEDYRLGIGITSIDMNVGNVKDTDRRSFDLTTPYRIFSFLADSEQHKDQWVEAMRDAIGEALSNSEVANQIWAERSNGCCADCGAAKPEWAAINLCVVVCKRCAGEHRGLGPSISKVRSLKMDRRVWTEELIQVFLLLGNERLNRFWAANVPPSEALSPTSCSEARRRFVSSKYRQGKYRKYHPLYGNQEELNNALCINVQCSDVLETLCLVFCGADVNCSTGQADCPSPLSLALAHNQKLQAQFLSHNLNTELPRSEVTGVMEPQHYSPQHPVTHNGFLFKTASMARPITERKAREEFSRRWCTLNDGNFSYYESDKTSTPNGTLKSTEMVCLAVNTPERHGYNHTFELYSDSERIYLFGTDGPDSHKEWVKSITKTFIPSNAEGLLRLAFERIGRLRYKDGLNLQSPRVGWFALVGSSLHAYLEDSVEEEEIHLRKLQELSIQQENEVLVLVERGRTLYIEGERKLDFQGWCVSMQRAAGSAGDSLSQQQLTETDIPVLVDRCIDYITQCGLTSEGIYRKSGVNSRVAALCEAFRRDARSVRLKEGEHQVDDVSNTLKRFFRESGERLFTTQAASAWLSTPVIPEESSKISQYQLLLSRLPRVNKATLRALVNHLYCVQRFAELNQMNLHNLAIVFGPTLFQTDGKDFTAGLVVEELIEHYTDVFEVDEQQLKRQLDEITAIIKVREKLNHNSSVPASGSAGDFICTVYLEEWKETAEQHVKIPGSMTAAELTCEILDRRKIQVREKDYWSCWEVSQKEEMERPLHHLERVLPIIHSLGTDSHLLVKKHLAMEAIRIYLASKVDVSKHGMVKFREERSILGLGLNTGSFHDRYFILSTVSLRMYKEVRSNRPEREWQVKNLRVYLGIKKKLRSPTCWGLTVINGSEKQEKPDRQQWYLCCDTQTEMREWFSTFLTIQYDGNVWPADAVQTRVPRALPADTRHGNVALIPLRGSENEMRNSVAAFTADPLGLFRDV
ncbi:arf-GAP with Rho-GAP domain, ANK repeat and PH domain-containing protein 1-like isoform X1 [Salvelinus alpinus]|uniref:arf-GAP with Rho-GAP domain, ANK repeat and PH domain-containing protein 1-like isoform X1 n=2 Tax=Salvelinus alpinus TaxID=8036 RepID=UPI0039FC6C0D